jgi:hypothetical protein
MNKIFSILTPRVFELARDHKKDELFICGETEMEMNYAAALLHFQKTKSTGNLLPKFLLKLFPTVADQKKVMNSWWFNWLTSLFMQSEHKRILYYLLLSPEPAKEVPSVAMFHGSPIDVIADGEEMYDMVHLGESSKYFSKPLDEMFLQIIRPKLAANGSVVFTHKGVLPELQGYKVRYQTAGGVVLVIKDGEE